MPKTCYVAKKFSRPHRSLIDRTNLVLEEYAAQGFVLTLRQLYYQFVARRWIANKLKSYKMLGKVVGDARLAGRIDWDQLEDRTRNLRLLQHFAGAQDALNRLASWYHVDMWAEQKYRPEVWIEKDALAGVISGVCDRYDVPYFSCRGYTSLSEMYGAAMRLNRWLEGGQIPYLIHFGDHDPSGIDMSRDIFDRIEKTFRSSCSFVRAALTMDQVEEYDLPPNPAKVADSRYKAYVKEFGTESWELDALEPKAMANLIENRVESLLDKKQWDKDRAEKENVRNRLVEVASEWKSLGELKRKVEQGNTLLRLGAEREDKLRKEVERLKKKKRKGDGK